MEATIESKKTIAQTKEIIKPDFWNKMEFSRYGVISMLVIIIGCLGGIAAAFGAHDSALELSLIAFPTIISLALILAVAPMRAIVYLCSIAIVLDLIVLIF